MSQLDLFDPSDWQATLEGVPSRLPTSSWVADFIACEAVATLPWAKPDEQLQAIFDHGTGVHEATAARYVGLEPVVEAESRIDIESRCGVALVPELAPLTDAGAVEVPMELTPDATVMHAGDVKRAQHRGLYGRADYLGRDIDDRLRVLDLKTGNPDYLQAPLSSWQLRSYAVMAWEIAARPDAGVWMSFAAVRAACRTHTWGPWESACPDCRRARPTAQATPALLTFWAESLRKYAERARELQDGAGPAFKPEARRCNRCRAKDACPVYAKSQEAA